MLSGNHGSYIYAGRVLCEIKVSNRSPFGGKVRNVVAFARKQKQTITTRFVDRFEIFFVEVNGLCIPYGPGKQARMPPESGSQNSKKAEESEKETSPYHSSEHCCETPWSIHRGWRGDSSRIRETVGGPRKGRNLLAVWTIEPRGGHAASSERIPWRCTMRDAMGDAMGETERR